MPKEIASKLGQLVAMLGTSYARTLIQLQAAVSIRNWPICILLTTFTLHNLSAPRGCFRRRSCQSAKKL
jgi:hypothetical protein